MSVENEISRISNNVKNALNAVEEQGVAVPANATSDNLADLIATIGNDCSISVSKTGSVSTLTVTDKNGTQSVQIEDGEDGTNGINGTDGKDGISATHSWDGTVLTVTSASGTSSANLKGDKGDKGEQGERGLQGEQGIQGIQGEKGETGDKGADGANGKDGTSVTVKSVSESTADGGNNVITFSDGKTVTIKNGTKGSAGADGAKGDTGAKGDQGVAGVGIKSVTQTTTSSADGGSNVITVTKTDNTTSTFTVKNGSKGSKGDKGDTGAAGRDGLDGEDGYSPVRGVDYWTEEDKEEINADSQNFISTELAKRNQLKPEFVNSIEECTDTTKLYVLPDGYIYAYMLTEVESGPSYTNQLPLSTDASGAIYNGTGYKNGFRLNSSATEKEQANCGHTGFIKASPNAVLRIKNIPACTVGYGYIHYFKSDKATAARNCLSIGADTFTTDSNGVSSFTLPDSANIAYIRFSYGTMSANSIITINEEITEGGGTTTDYAWVSTGHAFAPADYEDRIVDLENTTATHSTKIANLEGAVGKDNSLMFISPDGNDSNNGLTSDKPKKTVKACVNAGAKRISAKRGIYKENIALSNIKELEIFPTDNDLTYAVGEERELIVFDTSDTLAVSSLATYNSIKRVAYSNSANTQFDKVFTKQSQPPVIGEGYGSRYNSTVWLLSNDEKTVCIKLKPVLTVAECEAETNTFTYVSGYIYINANLTGVDKVIVPTNWDTGFYINKAQKIVLKEVEVRFSGTYNIDLRNCAFFDLYKCACKYTSYGSGFHPFNSNGVMKACYATKNYDGYGISGYGHTTYIDCVSEFNFDDGMSHHDGTEGTVIGGRYEGNGKGGVTPAYGAKVNIYGGLYKDNASFGIGYLWASGLNPASGLVQNAVMVGNPIGLAVNANCSVTAMSCVYKNNTKDKENKGLLTEY